MLYTPSDLALRIIIMKDVVLSITAAYGLYACLHYVQQTIISLLVYAYFKKI